MSPRNLLLFLAIPTLALLVAGRQLYLSTYHDLSTWKGGGMGMFASADTLARYVRVFIETPDQKRILINKLTYEQNDLLLNTMYYPSERNLNTLGASLRQTSFSASREPTQVTRFDQSGNPLAAGSTSYIVASARDDNPAASELDLPIIVELWEFSYDPGDRLLKASPKRTVRLVAGGKRSEPGTSPGTEPTPDTGAVPKL
ncbi:MAG: hypothetical protein HKP56_02415 [Anderseniella sp.]|nr:hypothetical protein [Anderseniella sp.]